MKTHSLFSFTAFLFLNLSILAQCPATGYTCIPDSAFEQALISLTLDDVEDGRVLTANISGITFLDVSSKAITDLTGIEDFAALEQLNCHLNSLTSLDLSNNSNLRILLCNNNQINNTLDLSSNSALESAICNNNQLDDILLPSTASLTRVDCHFNNLTSLDVTGAPNLDRVNITQNSITSINLANNTVLTEFFGTLSGLQGTLDLSSNTILERVDCDRNSIAVLNLPTSSTLLQLRCWDNNLTTLDVSNLSAITYLDCGVNNIASLDVSNNPTLEEVYCHDNELIYLDLKNGASTNIDFMWATGNPNLDCIQVDDVTDAQTKTANNDWYKDAGAEYMLTCPALSTENFIDESILVYPNPTSALLNVKLETEATYSLVNVLGKVITKGHLISGESQLNVSNMSSGIYYLKIENAEGSLIKTIVKN